MKKDGLENVRLDPVKVPHWVRGAESADIVAPAGIALAMLGLGNSVGTPAGGHRGRAARGPQLPRARRRAAIASRDASCSSTSRSRATARRCRTGATGPSRAAARGAVAALVRVRRRRRDCARRTPARCDIADGQPQIPAAAIVDRRCRPAAAHAGSRHPRARPPQDGGQVPARRRLVQRHRRDSRPRASRRGRRRRRPHRLLGRRHRCVGRWRRLRGDVGGASPDEEAGAAAAAHGARRPVHQRGERPARRRSPTAIATATSSPITS